MTTEYPIRHTIECTQSDNYTTTGRYGDPLLRCRTCGRFRVLDAEGNPSEPPRRTPSEARPAVRQAGPVDPIPRELRLEAAANLGVGMWRWSDEAADFVRVS